MYHSTSTYGIFLILFGPDIDDRFPLRYDANIVHIEHRPNINHVGLVHRRHSMVRHDDRVNIRSVSVSQAVHDLRDKVVGFVHFRLDLLGVGSV